MRILRQLLGSLLGQALSGTRDSTGTLHQALAAYDRGDWAETEHHCRSLLSVHPDHAEALSLLGIVAMRVAMLRNPSAC